MSKRILLVSNRLPVTIDKKKQKVRYKPSPGGLATGLGSFYRNYESLWIGWSGVTEETLTAGEWKVAAKRLLEEYRCAPVFLTRADIKNYYYGFCNKTVWPLFHYFPNYTVYDKFMWQSYEKVNERFRDMVMKHANPDDTIWIQDYQLLLLPRLLRERMPAVKIGFFLHIPFPSFEIFRLLPWRNEILEGMMGADLIGFHTYDYVRHFLSSVSRILGYEHTLGQFLVGNRFVKVDAFPMGIDYERFSGAPKEEEVRLEIERIKKKIRSEKIILSVDRLDYTKGILNRLEAFDFFLKTNPAYRGKVTLILVAVPSRTGVETYRMLKREIDEMVGRINGAYSTIEWMPVWYLYQSLPFHKLAAFYFLSDVALVTPLRDGMNLIAKEYVATKGDGNGILILSGMAGSVHELGEALIVNPHNREQVAEAIKTALEIPQEEQREKNRVMQQRLKRYDVNRWAHDFVERLETVATYSRELNEQILSAEVKKKLINGYKKSFRRLVLLDYDGTLVRFVKRPEHAKPDQDLGSVLRRLAADKKNEVVIISGRDKETLENWFSGIDISFVAEHGVWLKERGVGWSEIEPLRNEWKDDIRPILDLYVDRTPGSFIEEKEFSLVWHYRKADPEFALIRVSELREILVKLTENFNIGIMEGNKVLEIKNAGINKGRAAQTWISKGPWDFILAIGDDVTDEDIFQELPGNAYSIKVGFGPTRARYNIGGVGEVRLLLQELSTAPSSGSRNRR
ncbi:MAG: bifunctional alpha,alpha-trehalose-phosphate synthase (UDP-forming)/trehalose-phosphatase [Spirochaetes bacterium]|nr:bifunctional alpha,alpha-trehalose-phosphate synthase (UDP-forming)/trehalose-phosphatase [Spirochaetota bacterium]